MSKIQVDTIDTRSGTATMQIGSTNTSTITLGVSGDTINVPSGVTIANAGTATGFGANTPYFKFRSDGQTIANTTDTLIEFDTEVFKSSGSASFDTTNHRYLPTTAGYYVINVAVRGDENAVGDRFILQIRKNGTVQTVIDGYYNDLSSVQATAIIECNGSSDYIDAIIYQNTGSTLTIANQAAYSFFMGYKIIT